MKKSQRTKDCKRLAIVFRIASLVCWLGVAIFAVVTAFSKVGGSNKTGVDILSDAFKAKLISLSITAIIGIILALLIKEKARVTVYMLSLLILSIIYGEAAMYSVLGVWALDEYILTNLFHHYKSLARINVEIDRRG